MSSLELQLLPSLCSRWWEYVCVHSNGGKVAVTYAKDSLEVVSAKSVLQFWEAGSTGQKFQKVERKVSLSDYACHVADDSVRFWSYDLDETRNLVWY